MDGLIFFLILAALGFFIGSATESAHYQSIRQREKATLRQMILTCKRVPKEFRVESASLALGSVVISVDYFKQILAGFRAFFGGEVKAYSSLIDRARREAILRMKEAEPGADFFVNVRLETAPISSTSGRESIGSIEMTAYGTAVFLQK